MTETKEEAVYVRDNDGLWQIEGIDERGSTALLGALSADPRSVAELRRAALRYPDEAELDSLTSCDPAAPPTGPWIVIDLACQRLAAGGGGELPESPGGYQCDSEPGQPEAPVVWINFPPHWEVAEGAAWQDALPTPPPVAEPLDFRGVLFGRAMAADLARRTLEAAGSEALPEQPLSWDDFRDSEPTERQRQTANRWHDLTVGVHRDWLMTPREDLEGRCPRHFLHAGRTWVDLEMHHRQVQWSRDGAPPQPLDRDSLAYRHGPPGCAEVVVYFDFCREMIAAAWRLIADNPRLDEGELTRRLYDHGQWWLSEGTIDGDPTPPAAIIESERRRTPLVADANHFDCDCPICRMEAEGGFGPAFICFDGHHLELDGEFAFSLMDSEEEFRELQIDMEEIACRDRSSELPGDGGRDAEQDGEAELQSVWSSSFVDESLLGSPGASAALKVMALAARLAEVVEDLKQAGAERRHVEALNEAFDKWRAAAGDPQMALVAGSGMAEVLEAVVADHPQLTGKAADLQSQLDEHRRS